MEGIRPESETDRTARALAQLDATLPLRHRRVEIEIDPGVAETEAGQKLLVVLVNELARMKGVVEVVHVVGLAAGTPVLGRVPLPEGNIDEGLAGLVGSLNHDRSEYRSAIEFTPANDQVPRAVVGRRGELALGADGWRALVGEYATQSDWGTQCPVGPALAAGIGGAELFKRLLDQNYGSDSRRRAVQHFAFSGRNYGVDQEAAGGPDPEACECGGWAVIGCGAGGTAALYVLGMAPGVHGPLAVVEPGHHKESNLNRYLMTSATDVHEHRHKLDTLADHCANFAPDIELERHEEPWEQLRSPGWTKLVTTVDTAEARWAIKRRAPENAVFLDAAVLGLQYTVLRVVPGGFCLECLHPFDAEHELKQRAVRWGVDLATVRDWHERSQLVTREMLQRLTAVQNRPEGAYDELLGKAFTEVPALTECGDTPLRVDVPSQAPSLPLATTVAGTLLAGEMIKSQADPDSALSNWWDHHLGVAPRARRLRLRPPRTGCSRH